MTGVYPRVCGGTRKARGEADRANGLSPRVRGNRDESGKGAAGYGSIPACAGEPSPRSATAAYSSVYPRVCGGTMTVAEGQLGWTGLSPRVRGNPGRGAGGPDQAGSIPACAGEPEGGLLSSMGLKVYPRVCGGTWTATAVSIAAWGLSPRVRGNLVVRRVVNKAVRSIPACAGEPFADAAFPQPGTVYPRVCGGTSPS